MKKYLNLIIVLIISVFIGVGIACATSGPNEILSFSDKTFSYDSKTVKDESSGTRVTTVTVYAKPTKSDTVSGTQSWEVKLTKNKSNDTTITTQKVEVVSSSVNGEVVLSTFKETSTGATFDYTYKGTQATEGQKYELFTLLITQGPDSSFSPDSSDCGGTISPVSGSSGGGNTDVTPTPEPTGFSIPVAIIGFGSLAGISIMASTRRKPKMHRI